VLEEEEEEEEEVEEEEEEEEEEEVEEEEGEERKDNVASMRCVGPARKRWTSGLDRMRFPHGE